MFVLSSSQQEKSMYHFLCLHWSPDSGADGPEGENDAVVNYNHTHPSPSNTHWTLAKCT